MSYTVTPEARREFAAFFMLDKIVSGELKLPLLLDGDYGMVEDIVAFMISRDLVDADGNNYKATSKGYQVVTRFKQRFQDFLKNFDLYCAVDLEEGEFAFAEYWEFEDEEAWETYLAEEHWEDLRVAVAIYKGLDPVELVFLGFVNEGRFSTTKNGWQFDLALGSAWDEIPEVCNTALGTDDLAYDDIPGEDVLRDIIAQGSELNRELWEDEAKEAAKPKRAGFGGGAARVVRKTAEPKPISDEVYRRYCGDPKYVSPVWKTPLL